MADPFESSRLLSILIVLLLSNLVDAVKSYFSGHCQESVFLQKWPTPLSNDTYRRTTRAYPDTTFPPARIALLCAGLELREVEALRQKVSVWFGDETAGSLGTAAELRARLKRIAPDDVPFLQARYGLD